MSQNAQESPFEEFDKILEYFKILIEIDTTPIQSQSENDMGK